MLHFKWMWYNPAYFYLQGQNASAYNDFCWTSFPNVYIHTDLQKYIKKYL